VPRRVRAVVLCVVTFICVGALRVPLVWVMLALAPIAITLAWRDIKAKQEGAAR
jgi:hypothetical protein